MSTEGKIKQSIADHLGISVDDIEPGSRLQEELGLGPIELNDLLHGLSEEYDMVFTPEDIEGLDKVEDLIVLVEDNLLE